MESSLDLFVIKSYVRKLGIGGRHAEGLGIEKLLLDIAPVNVV
jgi:hypothetical protein